MADTAQPGLHPARTPDSTLVSGMTKEFHVSDTATTGKSASGLSGMLLPELKQLAQSLGITGASTMRKSALIEAISAKQSSGRSGGNGRTADNGAAGAKGRSADKADRDRTADRSDKADKAEQGERERAPRNDSRGDNRNDSRGDNRNEGRADPRFEGRAEKRFDDRKPFNDDRQGGPRGGFAERQDFVDRKNFGDRKEFGDRSGFASKPFGKPAASKFDDRKQRGPRQVGFEAGRTPFDKPARSAGKPSSGFDAAKKRTPKPRVAR